MTDAWYKDAIVYGLDVKTFRDSNADGVGDFRGLTDRLPYLADLGVNCLWLAPFFPSPWRDDGYDVTDFRSVDPRLGTLADFAAFVREAHRLGLRVIADTVPNHTSDEHPWFQSARRDRNSPYRDWFLWSQTEPPDAKEGIVFPGPQTRTWTYDAEAGAYYHHRFYDYMPDLDTGNPEVRKEMCDVARYWIEQGLDGYRVDAAPFLIEHREEVTGDPVTEFGKLDEAGVPNPYAFLDELRGAVTAAKPDAVLLAEANVLMEDVPDYFGPRASRMQMMFNFLMNQHLALALARGSAEPLHRAWKEIPVPPAPGQWLSYLRNHDEMDLNRLSKREREEVFAAFAPEEHMRAYGRGIRRRPASMLSGDRARIELAYSLFFTLPGSPMFRYGDEIGMGEDLSLPERFPVRTPMQWDSGPNGGFSTAPREKLVRPVIADGPFGCKWVNVAAQEKDPGSLLNGFRALIRAWRTCPELGRGEAEPFDTGDAAVFGVRHRFGGRTLVTLHNLGDRPAAVKIGGTLVPVFGGAEGEPTAGRTELDKYGYRWLRVQE